MADLTLKYDEEVVGSGHPTKEDTANRLMLVEHNNDGTHKNITRGLLLGMGCEYDSTSSVKVGPGCVEIGGGLFYAPAALTKSGLTGLSADTWHYLLASAPAAGQELSAAELSVQSAAPSFDGAKNGWYSGAARCIGFFLTDGLGNILEFYTLGNWWVPIVPIWIVNGAAGSGWTSVAANVPNLGRVLVHISASHDANGTNEGLKMRPGGSAITGDPIIYVSLGPNGLGSSGAALVPTSAGGNVDYSSYNNNITSLKLAWSALRLPVGLRG